MRPPDAGPVWPGSWSSCAMWWWPPGSGSRCGPRWPCPASSRPAEMVTRAGRPPQPRSPGLEHIGGAPPLINPAGVVPGSREANTTAITFLFFDPRMGFAEQTELARRFARTQVNEPDDHLVGVTGAIPGRLAQARTIEHSLPVIEAATL